MVQNKKLSICQRYLGNRNIEGFEINHFKIVKGKKPLSLKFSYICEIIENKKVMLRIVTPDTILNENLHDLLKWYESFYEKKETERYPTYGDDYLCLIVVFDGDDIKANIIDNKRYYYTYKDIKNLCTLNVNTVNDVKIEDKCDFIYNAELSKLAHDKFSKNSFISDLYSAEFDDKNIIGLVVNFCMDRNPISYYDAANMYFTFAEENKNLLIKDRGLTKNEIIELSNKFCRRVNEVQKLQTMTLSEAFNFLMYRIINQTFNGYYAEKQLMEVLFKTGYLIYKDEKLDIDYGIDFIAKNDNKTICVQVKSKYILKYCDEETIKCINKKYKKALSKGYETYYAFYNFDENNNIIWETNPEDGSCFFNIKIFN